jgi:hypothetical protein
MPRPAQIISLPITKWNNAHDNYSRKLKKHCSFKITLSNPAVTKAWDNYRTTTANFQWLIKHAVDNGIRLRAVGNNWSFSPVAPGDDGVVDTKDLVLTFNFKGSWVDDDYLATNKPVSNLFFTQCGVNISRLNDLLEKQGTASRSLKASGNTNGQSIAGATSTGTHGSAFNVGAVHECIVGLHIVNSSSESVWIERASYPVVSDEFLQLIQARRISDDEMFNSAVVSFGSFGFIHGILIETDNLFLLEEYRSKRLAYDANMKTAIDELDFSKIRQHLARDPFDSIRPLYHFEVFVNIHQFEPPDKKLTYGDDTLGFIQTVLDALGNASVKLIPLLTNALFPQVFSPAPVTWGTVGETFVYTKFRGKLASAALGIANKNATRVLEIMVAINKTKPFPGGVGLRFVKGTKATLGFNRYAKTCVIEMDGVDAKASHEFFKAVYDELKKQGIPFTLHWGKLNDVIDEQMVRNMFGGPAVDRWIKCRNTLLSSAVREVFNNAFLKKAGLDKSLDVV